VQNDGADEHARLLLERLHAAGARFLLVGRKACVLHGLPLVSFDYEIWADPAPANLEAVVNAARAAGFGAGVMPEVGSFKLENDDRIEVFKVEAFTAPDGRSVGFAAAYARRVAFATSAQGRIPVASIEDLIITKLSGRRKQDVEDVKALQVLLEMQRTDPHGRRPDDLR
jgi:hypothetical protein